MGHETDIGDVRTASLAGLSLAAGLALILLFVYGAFRYLAHRQVVITPASPLSEAAEPQIPPQPRIEEHPDLELKQLRANEDIILTTYGWTDKKSGVVRIPINRAMELQLQRGFPVRAEDVKK